MNMQNTERKILIADDDPQIRKMLEYILKSGGYKNIISAASCATRLLSKSRESAKNGSSSDATVI